MTASNEAATPLKDGVQGFLNSSGTLDPAEVYPPEADFS
jgi:hypothetical protein